MRCTNLSSGATGPAHRLATVARRPALCLVALVFVAFLGGCLDDMEFDNLFGPWDCETRLVGANGTVVDAVTHEPIGGAWISVPGGRGTTTDTLGRFSVSDSVDSCLDAIQAEVGATGYVSVHVLLSNGVEVELQPAGAVATVVAEGSAGRVVMERGTKEHAGTERNRRIDGRRLAGAPREADGARGRRSQGLGERSSRRSTSTWTSRVSPMPAGATIPEVGVASR